MWICPHYLISTPSPIRTGSATLNHNEIFVTLCVELWIAKYGDDFTKPWDHQKFVQNLSACLAATHILHSSDTLCAHSSQVFLEYKFWNAPEGGFFKTHIWALVTELLPCAQMLLLKLNYYSPILHSMADLIGLSFWARVAEAVWFCPLPALVAAVHMGSLQDTLVYKCCLVYRSKQRYRKK